ncbi:PREDICTED: sister chromatid cohesion 1 protein 2 isoform X3 [Tarenaya hassleriana]|uniref:sister chromatid cohesion 1 protein 2 isoform X3 n=1 Tax=Tarenaya hassleriana TaxID=28532 RepID=UPI00053C607D|nr:PREDICTED: sister chromatid cohesion 1 protein 2 isoform X3 [Tarenaya hassleriana]
MFYSQCLVSKKGPLGAIWVAAYFFKKLKKAQVKETDIPSSVDEILQKELETLAYRVLAYLLVGIVRIYSKKVDYLFNDCNKMLIGVKDFVTKEKNTRAEKANAFTTDPTPCFGIVLPKRFELDAFDLEILEDFHGGNVKPQDDITLKEGGWHGDRMGQHSMERFDVGDYSKVTFHETYSPDHENTECYRSACGVDIYAEKARSSQEVDAIRDILHMIEEETPSPNESGDNLDASCGVNAAAENVSSAQEEHIIKDKNFLVENPRDMDIDVENARSAQEEVEAVRETFCMVEEETQNPDESSGDHLNTFRNVDTDAENARSAQQGDSVREMPCVVESEPVNPSESFGDRVNSSEQKDLELDKTLEEGSREKMRHDGFHSDKHLSPEMIYGIERQHSGGVSQTNCQNEITPPGEVEPVSEIFYEGVENHQDHGDGERTEPEVAKSIQEPHTPGLVTSEEPPQLSIPEASGATSPHFSIIPTPAAKEGPRVSRKRKCVIDDTVVIPNKVMRQSLENSSELVTKRRKVPHTAHSAWRISRLANLSQCFLDPLIPYRPMELQVLSVQSARPRKPETMETPKAARTSGQMKDFSLETKRTPAAFLDSERMGNARETVEVTAAVADVEQPMNTRETVEIPLAGSLPELEVTAVENCTEIATETEVSPRAAGTAEQTEIAPETPVRESMSIRYFKSPESPSDKAMRSANYGSSFDKDPMMFGEDRDLDMILMQEEVIVHEKGNLQLDSLSARTRKVAKFLEKIFRRQRERVEEETVSLFQLCKGRTRKENARLFYETLFGSVTYTTEKRPPSSVAGVEEQRLLASEARLPVRRYSPDDAGRRTRASSVQTLIYILDIFPSRLPLYIPNFGF